MYIAPLTTVIGCCHREGMAGSRLILKAFRPPAGSVSVLATQVSVPLLTHGAVDTACEYKQRFVVEDVILWSKRGAELIADVVGT